MSRREGLTATLEQASTSGSGTITADRPESTKPKVKEGDSSGSEKLKNNSQPKKSNGASMTRKENGEKRVRKIKKVIKKKKPVGPSTPTSADSLKKKSLESKSSSAAPAKSKPVKTIKPKPTPKSDPDLEPIGEIIPKPPKPSIPDRRETSFSTVLKQRKEAVAGSKSKKVFRKYSWSLWLLAAVVGWYGWKMATQSTNGTIKSNPGEVGVSEVLPFKKRVGAPGTVEAIDGLRKLEFQISGKIKEILVDEGDQVKQGDLLARLDSEELASRLKEAEAELTRLKENFDIRKYELKYQIGGAEKIMNRDKAIWERLKKGARPIEIKAAEQRVASVQSEYDLLTKRLKDFKSNDLAIEGTKIDQTRSRKEAAFHLLGEAESQLALLKEGNRKEVIEEARNIYERSQGDWEMLKLTEPGRINRLKAGIEALEARVATLQSKLKQTEIRSPISGKVVSRHMNPGETILATQSKTVLQVVDPSKLQVRADVDEKDYLKIYKGQRVNVTWEANKGNYVEGYVYHVSDKAGRKNFNTDNPEEANDIQIVEAVVRFKDAPPLKLDGLARVYFEIKDEKPVKQETGE